MEAIFTAENIIALITLSALEIVLGIDNIVFIAILSGKLPPEKRKAARQLGLAAAMVMRILMLLAIGWISRAKDDWLIFSVLGLDVALSWRDIILLVGGLFLIGKATLEIHAKLEGPEEGQDIKSAATMTSVIAQIMVMDMIFSLDSVITAVGMAEALWVMITAVVIAVAVMMVFARPISDFVERHPTVKMLALSFMLLIGVMLVVEGFDQHINKGYIYFAMAFSLFVELLNMRLRKVSAPVPIHQPRLPGEGTPAGRRVDSPGPGRSA